MLAVFFEHLTLTGAANVNGAGNAAATLIIGNIGDNALIGGTGADTLAGCRRRRRHANPRAGNDVYDFDAPVNPALAPPLATSSPSSRTPGRRPAT